MSVSTFLLYVYIPKAREKVRPVYIEHVFFREHYRYGISSIGPSGQLFHNTVLIYLFGHDTESGDLAEVSSDCEFVCMSVALFPVVILLPGYGLHRRKIQRVLHV